MWEFLSQALEKGGPALLAVAVIFIMFGWTVRVLWADNQILHGKLEAIQEKRVVETKEVAETIIENMRELDRAVDTLSTAMDTLTRLRSRHVEEDEEC